MKAGCSAPNKCKSGSFISGCSSPRELSTDSQALSRTGGEHHGEFLPEAQTGAPQQPGVEVGSRITVLVTGVLASDQWHSL